MKSFAKQVKEAIGEDIEIRFIPDEYKIDINNKTILLVENVKSNDLDQSKIIKLGTFWFECDYYGWDVNLKVKHWYGAESNVSLMDFYYNFILNTKGNQ